MSDIKIDPLSGIIAGVSTLGSIITNGLNTNIGYQNADLQRQAYERSIRLQDLTMLREDTAAQRRMSDLKAAGLNPVLAAGASAQTSQPMRLEAPQNQARFTNPMPEALGAYSQMATLKAQLDATQASIEKTKADTQRTIVETERLKQQTPIETEGMKLANLIAGKNATIKDTEIIANNISNEFNQRSLDARLNQIELLNRNYDQEYLNKVAEQAVKIAQEALIKQQTKTESEKTLLTGKQAEGQGWITYHNRMKGLREEIALTIDEKTMNTMINTKQKQLLILGTQLSVLQADEQYKKLINEAWKNSGLSPVALDIIRSLIGGVGTIGNLTKGGK